MVITYFLGLLIGEFAVVILLVPIISNIVELVSKRK